MKVSDLFEEALPDYLKRLVKKHGIKKLGGGAYSQVFQHPHYHNVVVKVYTAKDVKYARYLAWVMKNQSNPYVPKVIEQHKHFDGKNKYFIVFMQKMSPIKTSEAVVKLLARALGIKPGSDEYEDLGDVYDYGEGSGSEFVHEFSEIVDAAVKAKTADPDFVKVWKQIKKNPEDLDMHSGNVMTRDGHLVVTDPVADDPGSDRVDEY